MRSVLLDTHAYLWFVFDDPRLSDAAARLISDPGTRPVLSIASVWELTIKHQIGKLELGMPLEHFLHEFIASRELDILPVSLADMLLYGSLPLHHRDPFDRILVAQAQRTAMVLVTADAAFSAYSLETVW